MIWCNWVGSSSVPAVATTKGTIEATQLD
jgi:hypothetical protein